MDQIEPDIELKFDGPPIKDLGGAPAEAVISALTALQRLVHLIGMKAEGRVFRQRAKPSARVRQEYAIICKVTKEGSHVQPFDVRSSAGAFTTAASFARTRLLETLKAFDSGDVEVVKKFMPDPRERWFLATAASGLVPSEESKIQITIRPSGSTGHFSFKADRARLLIDRFRSGSPPSDGVRKISGRLKVVDFENYVITVHPVGSRAFRLPYPPSIESFIQNNKRRRISIVGIPEINAAGDISRFEQLNSINEMDSSIAPIESFISKGDVITTDKPLRIITIYDNEDNLFIFQDSTLGIDVYSEEYSGLKDAVLDELDVLWRNYALASDEELASDALLVKKALVGRFRKADNAEG